VSKGEERASVFYLPPGAKQHVPSVKDIKGSWRISYQSSVAKEGGQEWPEKAVGLDSCRTANSWLPVLLFLLGMFW